MSDTLAEAISETWPRPVSRLKSILLLGAGMLAPIIVVSCIISGRVSWNLPTAKRLLLAGEYFGLLPALIWLGSRRGERGNLGVPPPTRLTVKLPFIFYFCALLPLAFILGFGIYQGDESAYLFQARCLNSGRLFMAQPPVPVNTIAYSQHVVLDGKWFGKYPLGWPAVLSIGALTGFAWLINPLLGGMLLWVTYRLGKELFGREEGKASTVILAFSAFFVLNCLGFMSHVLSGLLIALATLCYAYYSSSNSFQWIAAMFASLAATALVRPFTALCVGAALITACNLRWSWSALVRFLIGIGLLVAIIIGVTALQNRPLTGSYFLSPYAVYGGGTMHEISFRIKDIIESLVHITPMRIVYTGSVAFPFVFPLALYGLWRQKSHPLVWVLALIFTSLVIGHIIQIDSSDSPIGERYYFEAYFAVALLAGIGWVQFRQDLHWSPSIRREIALTVCAISLGIMAVCTYWEVGLRWPSRQIAIAASHPPFTQGIVFLIPSGRFEAGNFNMNHSGNKVLFLRDPGQPRRAWIAEVAGERNWACLTYDEASQAAAWKFLNCEGRSTERIK